MRCLVDAALSAAASVSARGTFLGGGEDGGGAGDGDEKQLGSESTSTDTPAGIGPHSLLFSITLHAGRQSDGSGRQTATCRRARAFTHTATHGRSGWAEGRLARRAAAHRSTSASSALNCVGIVPVSSFSLKNLPQPMGGGQARRVGEGRHRHAKRTTRVASCGVMRAARATDAMDSWRVPLTQQAQQSALSIPSTCAGRGGGGGAWPHGPSADGQDHKTGERQRGVHRLHGCERRELARYRAG